MLPFFILEKLYKLLISITWLNGVIAAKTATIAGSKDSIFFLSNEDAKLAAITPFNQVIDINNLYNFSKMKKGSIGGIETYGKMRLLTC